MDTLSRAYPYLPYFVIGAILIAFILIFFLVFTLRRAQKKEPLGLGIEEGGAPEGSKEEGKRGGLFSPYTLAWSLGTSFSRALKFLRGNVSGRNYLYQIPWYMVVGESGSGKTTLLESVGIRASLREGEEDFGVHQAIQWRFFNQGIVLDVYGDYILQPDDLTSNETGWETLLRQLQRHRARRPIDGVVITLPCTDFLGPRSQDVETLEAKAARLYEKLWRAQTIMGMSFPIYVIVSKCDVIPGFRGFCQEIPGRCRGDILGWSSPYGLATSFIPAWVDEAFESLTLDLHRLQCEIFAERRECQNADEVFLFPGEFQSMQDGLRIFLARLFKETAYRESFLFRGLYFCGDFGQEEREVTLGARRAGDVAETGLEESSLASTSVPPSSPRRPIFLTRLFEDKIFPEASLAHPIARFFRRQSRVVWVAQTVALVLAIVLAWGATARYRGMLQVNRTTLLPLLQQVAGEMKANSEPSTGAQPELAETACDLTNDMHKLDMGVFSSVFIPISLASSLNESVKQAMLPAFRQEVLVAAKKQLISIATKLSTPLPPALPQVEPPTAESGGGGGEEFKTYPVEKTQELLALQSFTAELVTLHQNVARYNDLIAPGKGTTEDLRGLVGYLGCPLPTNTRQNQYFHNQYFENVLRQATGDPFDEQGFSSPMSNKLLQLDDDFFNARFAKNPVWLTLNGLQVQINDLEDQQVGSYEDLKNLDGTISSLRNLLKNPNLSWMSKPSLDLTGPIYLAAVEPIRETGFFSPQMETSIQSAAQADFQNLKAKLETTDTGLTGNLLAAEESGLQLSPNTINLQLDLENVLNLPFMEETPTHTMRTTLPSRTRLMWNPDLLAEALSLHDSFDRFSTEGLRNSTPNSRAVFRRVALAGLQSNMLDLIAQAQSFEPVPASETENSATGANAAQLKSFEDAEPHLSQILDVFRRLGLSGSYAGLQKLTTSQAATLLAGLDAELAAEEPYDVKDGNFYWWHGESTPALMAFDVQTTAELEAYLTFQRQHIESLSSQATSLINFLSPLTSTLSETQSRSFDQWRQIAAGLKSYDEKIPSNPVAELQDFIRTDMNKFNPDQYCQGVTLGSSETKNGNFFTQKRDDLQRGIYERCKNLADMAAYRNYSEEAQLFDRTLAGKFPFAESGAEDPTSEADPAAIQTFYQLFDQHETATRLALTLTSGFGSSRMPALSFLEQMESLRPVFASVLPGGNDAGVLAFDFLPTFRVNEGKEIGGNQIIDWTLTVGTDQFRDHEPQRAGRWKLGDPLGLSLRWAKDSTVVPLADKTQPDLRVEGRDATFDYNDEWSLFSLLTQHHASAADFTRFIDPHPYTLAFTLGNMTNSLPIKKQGSAIQGQTKVFVQLTIMAPGKKESLVLPSFPEKAPLLLLAPPGD